MKKQSIAVGAAVLLLAVLAVLGLLTPPPSAGAASEAPSPIAGVATDYALSIPVRDLKPRRRVALPSDQAPPRINPLAGEADRETRARGHTEDPLAASSSDGSGRTPSPGLVFEGTGNPAACGGCSPPDTSGDVGPNHYIQMVNATKVAIYNKSGALAPGSPFDLGSLWPVASPCRANDGDPVVLYDEAADRWLLSQFFDSVTDHGLCFAISQTADPTGAYHLFQFSTPDFPDYFKVGVWPGGYYVSANESSYTAYAFDRTKMLAGDATASFVRFAGQTNFLMPADVDGPTQPTGGGLFYTFKDNAFASHGGGADRIELFRLTPDFTTPANSTFTPINTFPIASFTYTVCGFFKLNCIPQGGTSQKVDPVSEWPMQRLAFRKFDDHEALVGNFTVKSHTATATTAGAGIRWFELRNTGSGWSLFQEGTHDPTNGIDRWMGSIAVDQAGNIALGYSASNRTLFPSLRYATRAPGDPAGTLQAENTLHAGGGSQTLSNRWGDYSAMSVDPTDDCTFWYTNEYYSVSATTTWKTKIGNFVVPGCTGPPAPAFFANPTAINFGTQAVGTNSAFQTVTVTNNGTANMTISSAALATGNVGDFAEQNDTCTGATLTPSQTCSVDAQFAPTATGLRATELRFTDNAAGSPHDVHLSGDGSTGGGGGGGDTTAPETTITKAPKKRTKSRRASFQFSSSEPGSSFECTLDGKALPRPASALETLETLDSGQSPRAASSCSSPVRFRVKRGRHTFTVRATDAAGNADQTPATARWKVKKRRR